MSTDAITEFLQLSVNGSLPQFRPELDGIEEDVNVLGKPLDQILAFRQACAALKDHLIAGAGGDDSQCFRDVVVLLDDGRA